MPNHPQANRRIIFYDGECGLCARSVQSILDCARGNRFHFAPLQGETAAQLLPPELRNAEALSTMVYLETNDSGAVVDRWLRSDAVLRVAIQLGGWRAFCARLVLPFPRSWRDAGYRLVARNRHRFGRSTQACRLPTPEERAQLLP